MTNFLKSCFSEQFYKNIEIKFDGISNYISIISNFIIKHINFNLCKKQSFLDIGAGPGLITKLISKFYKDTTIIEPNPEYFNLYNKNYFIINSNFPNIKLKKLYDLILCSHVIYHIPLQQWELFLEKSYSALQNNGKAIIAIIAPSGKFHKLCSSLNKNYGNSNNIKHILEKLKIKYKINRVLCNYTEKTRIDFYKLIKLFAIDDCFNESEYNKLKVRQKKIIDAKINIFVDSCRQNNNCYSFDSVEDYIVIYK